jgi:hypothetical protein
MSASSVDPFDLAEQLARIRRMQEESDKFSAEQHKLTEEALKLASAHDLFKKGHGKQKTQ